MGRVGDKMAKNVTVAALFRREKTERQEIEEVRKEILGNLLYVLSLLGLPAAVLGAVQAYRQGRWIFAAVYILVYLVFVLSAFSSRRLPYFFRAVIVLLCLFSLAVAILARIGMAGAGLPLMITVCFLAAVFFGFRIGALMGLVCLAVISTVAVGMTSGLIPVYPEHMLTSLSGRQWVTIMIVFFMIVSITIIAPEMFIRRIRHSVEDLEEQKRRTDEANERSRRAIEILDNNPTIAFLWRSSEGWPVEFVSDNVERVFGYTREEFVTGAVAYGSLIHPEDLPRVAGEVRRFSVDTECRNFAHEPYRIITKTGEIRWVSDTTQIRRNNQGQVTHYQGIVQDISDLKQAEAAARAAEERFRRVVEIAPWGIFVDVQGTLVYVNPAFMRLTGAERPEQLIGTSLLNWVVPEIREKVAERIRTINEERAPIVPMERKHIRLDGTMLDVEAVAAPIDFAGQIGGMGMVRDITEKKLAEEALRRSEERYRLLLDSAPVGIYLSKEGRITYVNKEFTRIMEALSPEELIGRQILDHVHPDTREAVLERRRTVSTEHKSVPPFDHKFIRLDGRIIDVTVVAAPDTMEGIGSSQVFVLDNTERKRTEGALREKTEELERYFTTALDLLCIADMDGNFIRLNREWERVLGFRVEEMEGKPFLDFVHPEDRQRTLAAVTDLTSNKEVLSFTNRYRCKDGTYRFVEWRSIPVGKRIHAAARDVTERIRVEDEIRRHKEHLEELVKERTRELETAQQELLTRERLSALGQLTATVSHELRNPLGVIRSSAFYVQEKTKGFDEKVKKHLNRIEEQVELCDTIVGDLLEYTRGRHSEVSETDVASWLGSLLETMQGVECISIHRSFSDDAPKIFIDPHKMGRAVNNLLGNALQAVREHAEKKRKTETPYRPEIRLSTFTAAGSLLIVVEDNGTGMDEETAEKAFEPLFTTRARGTGLGLAIVRKIVEEHGGRVSLKSRLEVGTEVTIEIPVRTVKPL
ncbi:MAG: PAS domain S-box protein [Desulfobacteraceae bacterium]|nr:MAG: PAS domain S-box protein [Desulfobacteraceae bacterium]